jgi:hypothetical protein
LLDRRVKRVHIDVNDLALTDLVVALILVRASHPQNITPAESAFHRPAAKRTYSIRRKLIPQLIFGLVYLLILTRFIWPFELPLSVKIVLGALALVALQFHRWSRLSSGSEFSPEFPRPVVALFNWAFGTIVLLALLQIPLDIGLLFRMLIHGGIVSAPDGVRYGIAALAAVAGAIGVHQAMRIPPLKDIEVGIRALPRQFDGYTILQLTDLHISRLFPGHGRAPSSRDRTSSAWT